MIALANVNGRIGRIETKTSKGGNQYVEFSLANSRGFGEKQETDWYHCIAFDKVAERLINGKAAKGSFIQVVGAQALEKFTRKDNTPGMAAKITVYDWAYVPTGNGKKDDGQPSAPANGAQAPAYAGGGVDDFMEIDDDGDLPF